MASPQAPAGSPEFFREKLNLLDRLIQNSIAQDNRTPRKRALGDDPRILPRDSDPTPSPTPSPTSSQSTDESHAVEGYWHEDQIALNVILNARNEYTLMPSTWRYSLRGIPFPEGLFYRKTKDIAVRPRIYHHDEKFEYRGRPLHICVLFFRSLAHAE